VLGEDEPARSALRVPQNAAELAVRAEPSPVTTRQPPAWTVTGGNPRPPAANPKRTELPDPAAHVINPGGIFGSPHSAAARPRTRPGSMMLIPRGMMGPFWGARKAIVRVTTTLVSCGMFLHKATAATAAPPGVGAAPGPSAEAG